MSPKYVNKSERKKEIAQAALPHFSNGYTEASISKIAEAAGIGKGTIYEYFSNKKELFLTAIETWVSSGIEEVRKRVSAISDPEKRIKEIVTISNEIYAPSNHNNVAGLYLSIMQQTFYEGGVFYDKKAQLKNLSEGFTTLITETISDGVRLGIFKKEAGDNADLIARNLVAFLDGWEFTGIMSDNGMAFDTHVNLFLDGMIVMIKA